MKTSKNKPGSFRSGTTLVGFCLLILVGLIAGCVPPSDQNPLASHTPLPPSPSSTPEPVPTGTLELLDSGLVYIAVGLFPEGILPIYQEPSLSAGITSQIPATGKSIRTTGIEMNADGITWLQIEYQGSSGWVDSAYLALQKGDISDELVALAQSVAFTLKTADYQKLEDIVHPELCLRFSPYPYLWDNALAFCPGELAALPGSNVLYTWGHYDGIGEPIELPFKSYHERFIYDQDYYRPEVVGLNEEVGSGNSINNLPEIFPDGMIVEYHFPGFDPQYGGMDWRSLRMVFIEENGIWYLVALVHGEWTI